MNSDDIVLLLYLIDKLEKVEGRKRLQKLIYILKNEDNIPFTFSFRPYYYGPIQRSFQMQLILCVVLMLLLKSLLRGLVEFINIIIFDKGRNILQNQLHGIQSIINKLDIVIERLKDIETWELVIRSKKIQSKNSE